VFGLFGGATTKANADEPGFMERAVDKVCSRVALFCARFLPADWFSPPVRGPGASTPATSKPPVRAGVPIAGNGRRGAKTCPAHHDRLEWHVQRTVPAMVKVVLPPCREGDSAGGRQAVNSDCRVKPTGMIYRTALK